MRFNPVLTNAAIPAALSATDLMLSTPARVGA